jgi:hypothetical protein
MWHIKIIFSIRQSNIRLSEFENEFNKSRIISVIWMKDITGRSCRQIQEMLGIGTKKHYSLCQSDNCEK